MGFAGILRQSTAVDVLIGPFVDSTDGDAEETGLTIAQADVRLSKNGQAGAQKSDNTTCAHDADGFYNCELDATDTNTVGQLTLWVHVAGALAVRHDYQVIEEAVYDQLFEASAPGAATVAALATVDGVVDAIQAKTDNLPSDPADASVVAGLIATVEGKVDTVDTVVDAIQAKTDNLPSDPADASDIAAAFGALEGKVDTVDTVVDAIKAKTDNLPSDPADQSELAGLIGTVDTVVDAIKVTTDKLDDTLEDDGGTFRFTANALEEAPAGGGGGGGDATEAKQDTILANLATVDGIVDAIKAKTDALPADPADASDIAAAFAALEAKVDIVDGNVDDIETAIGLVAGVAGPGATPWVVLIDDGSDPLEGARVWVSTDAGMSNVVAGSLLTNSFGEVTFLLDAGTYYLWVRKDGYNPVLAEEFEVT